MISIIIAIISIALIFATLAASSYFGGDTLNEARAQTEASRLKIEEHQIMASLDVFNADHRRWPTDVQELVEAGYLISVPQGIRPQFAASSAGTLLDLMPAAYASATETASGWSMPVAQQPIFWTAMTVPKAICQRYNVASRGDNGILRRPFAELQAQCFGEDGIYQVLVRKAAAKVMDLGEALPGAGVEPGSLPAADAGPSWWDTVPAGEVQVVVDPDKKPFAKLQIATSSVLLGNVQVGQTRKSTAVTVTNQGNASAAELEVKAPAGFGIVDSTCGPPLSAGSSCTFAVNFAPTEARTYGGSVVVSSGNADVVQAQATGIGVAAEVRVTGIEFGNLPATEIRVGNVIAYNTGIDTLRLGSPVVDGLGFSLLPGGTCGPTLAAGAECSIKVQLTGTAFARHEGVVSILTEAGLKTASLTGQSQQALIHVSPAMHTFEDTEVSGASNGPTHIIENRGNIEQSPLKIAAPAGFRVNTTTCLAVLQAGQRCAVSFQFAPAAADLYKGVATVSGTAGVDLEGRGIKQEASLTNIELTQVPLNGTGTALATLKNIGTTPLTISAINQASVTGTGFRFNSSTCGAALAVGASCTISISYTASSTVPNTGSLKVGYGGGVLQNTLTGKGNYVGDALQYTGFVIGGGGAVTITSYVGNWSTNGGPMRFVNMTGSTLTGVTISLSNSTYFRAAANSCGSTIGVGQTCTFEVQYYAPGKGVLYSADIQVRASGYSSNTVTVRGSGY